MASERLQVILDMETGAYRREAKKASDSTKEIGNSAKQTGSDSDSMGTKLQGATTKMLALGASGAVVVGGISKAIDALQDMNVEAEAIENRFEQVFGEGADDVRQWSDEINERFGVSERAVRDLANGVADLLVPLGFTRGEASALTQETLTLANALSEWSGGNIDVADSTERIRKALLGERESLEALGVKVLQSDVNARLAAEGNDKLTGAEKARAEALVTLNIIQDKSTDAIAAYEDGTNKALIAQKKLQAAEKDRKDLLADALAPELAFITELYTAQSEGLAALIERLQEMGVAEADTAEETESLAERLVELAAESDVADTAEVNFIEGLAKGIDVIIEWRRQVEETTPIIQGSGSSAGEAATGVEGYAAAIGAYGERYRLLAGYYKITGQDARDAAAGNEELAQSFLNVLQARRELISPVFAAAQSQQRKSEAREAVAEARTGDFDTEAERVEAVSRAELDLLEATLEADVATEEYARTFRESFTEAEGIAEDLNIELLNVLETLGLLDDLAPVDLQIILGLEGPLGGIFIPENDPRNFPRPDRVTDPLGQPIGRFAHGGFMRADEIGIVGEDGPELFRPSVSGHIIPNNQLGGMGTTVTNIINLGGITVPGGVLNETDSARVARWLRRDIDRELADLRGGTV